MAVTKSVDEEMLAKLAQAGVKSFGENRIQQARTRLKLFPDIEWHFIGSLQTNKVRYCKDFTLIHSLRSLKSSRGLESASTAMEQTSECPSTSEYFW